jgi:hypothetical protein
MHLSFESLAIIDAPNLQAFFMDLHHNTSLKSILEDDSISSTSRVRICFCLRKVAGLWLVVRLFICSFHIAHFSFASTFCFCFNLIQPSIFSLLTCECGHELNAFGTHLVHCSFQGQ